MLFNSFDFAVFLPIVFICYWFVFSKNIKSQNLFVLFTSYVFYGWWDWRFLILIAISTAVDYIVGRQLSSTKSNQKRKAWLWLSILVNLGFLGFFKYYNFFLEEFINVFSFLGYQISASSLKIILPVGISFYTFQTLSYTIDVYKRKVEPTRDWVAFAAFVSFFPQLVAGPIERARDLLPQFFKRRHFDYHKGVDGLQQILWGLFKKVVIADNCAQFADLIFAESAELNGSALLLGAFFFAFQIYGDFSGYSDIAIGTARLFGFNLSRNFAFPYFSRDIAEFWRRWHISLTSWFKDYVYIPLGGSRGSRFQQLRNVFIVFMISGFWHGANWTFIFWGILHSLLFLPLLWLGRNRINMDVVASNRFLPTFKEALQMGLTFSLVLLGWIFFRAENLNHAFSYIGGIFSSSFFEIPFFNGRNDALVCLCLIFVFVIIEWKGKDGAYAIDHIVKNWTRTWKLVFYYIILICIFLFDGKEQDFIYFQF